MGSGHGNGKDTKAPPFLVGFKQFSWQVFVLAFIFMAFSLINSYLFLLVTIIQLKTNIPAKGKKAEEPELEQSANAKASQPELESVTGLDNGAMNSHLFLLE